MDDITVNLNLSVKAAVRARVLVVDDDPLIRDLHAVVLRMNGYEVVTAEDGMDALEQLADAPFDLMLIDRLMPGIDGVSVILALRSAGSAMPVVMVSGSLPYAPLAPAIAREISTAIAKPARIGEVLSAIALALSRVPDGRNGVRSDGIHGLAA